MKNIFIFILCFFSTILLAQEKETPLKEEWQNPNWKLMLSKLDTTQIKSGVLIDKVTSFANLLFFNTEKHNTSDKDHFIQAISELNRASNKSKFMDVEKFKTIIKNNTDKNQVLIGIINTNFEKLNLSQTKERTGGVTFNKEYFEPIEGKLSFLSRKLLVAAPLNTTVVGTEVDFRFSEELIFNNATSKIISLTINFDNGKEPLEIIKNSQIINYSRVIHFENEGLKSLQFNAQFEDQSRMTTYATIAVVKTSSTADLCTDLLKNKGTYQSSIPFQGYTESFPVLGQIEYETFYSTNNAAKKMNKPLIIVDGFDPGDTRKVQDCDCENDPTCRETNSPGHVFNPISHESIEESMFYFDENEQPKNVLNDLRDLGYDVIIINNPTYQVINQSNPTNLVFVLFPQPHWETRPNYVTIDGGADYIERNGRTLASFIKTFVKQEQNLASSNESLVLMGPSMGGQITRYALAYMEKQFADTGDVSWKHNARLWVSVDSPHLGASVPVAAQANIWFMGYLLGNQKAWDKYTQVLNSAAAKQMTIGQFQNALDTHTYGYAGGGHFNNSPFFDTYYNNINSGGVAGSGGYPVTTSTFRKIALTNGNLIGKKQGFESQKFLDVRAYLNINPVAYLTGGLVGAALLTDFFDSLFGSSNNIEIDFVNVKDYNTPAYGNSAILFEGSGFNPGFSYGINWGGIYCSPCPFQGYRLTTTNNSIKGSLDVAPSGYLKSTIKAIKDGIIDGGHDYYLATETNAYIQNHTFMPAFSGLAHLQPNQNWSNQLNTNLTCATNKLTPFDSYYGAENNTEHVTFTKESVEWLKEELAGNPQAPHFPIQAGLLTGPDLICENQISNYSFGSDVCKLPSLVQSWTVSPTTLQVISSNGLNIAVKGIGNGQGTITATFQNGQTVIKNIWVGKPSFTFEYTYYDIQPVKSILCVVSADPNVTLAQQGVTNIAFTDSTILYGNCIRTTSPLCKEATVTNACGSVTLKNDCEFLKQNTTSYFSVYPNPSDDIVNIEIRDANNLPVKGAIISGELFDMLGLSKSKVEIVNNKATFSVRGLNKGIYVLKIYINDQVESHQIGVQ